MSYLFGDSFDCYAVSADAITGYWDSGASANFSLVAGRFGGRCVQNNGSGVFFVKSSGVNDAVHHIVCAFQQTQALSGTTLGMYLQLSDAATNQVCIVFRSDGAILLTSATPAGTVLATYTSAVTFVSQWFAFEFEVVISATVGRFRVRKNGNTSDDFDSGATLNTRPGTNAYANKLTVGQQASIGSQDIDDLLWRSDAASVPFVGDIRCYVRMPVSDAAAVFSRSPSPAIVPQTAAASATTSKAANLGIMSAFTPAFNGVISSGTVQVSTGGTGNMKAAIYDSARTVALATANAVVNPTAGANAITFGTPLTVTKGTTYHLAVDQDFTIVYNTTTASQWSFTTTYASFPAASPTVTASVAGPVFTVNIATSANADYVSEAQQDAATTYVYSSNVSDTDLYNIASIAVTPASTIAVTTRAFVQKSDAGSRSGKVLLKSGGTTVDSGSAALSTTFLQMYRTDVTDPNTGSAWTAVAVNAVQVGVSCTA